MAALRQLISCIVLLSTSKLTTSSFPGFGACCEIKQQLECTRNLLYRQLDFFDNRYGSGALEVKTKSRMGSNKVKWEDDAYMKALSEEKTKETSFKFLVVSWEKKESNIRGGQVTDSRSTKTDILNYKIVENQFPVPAYSVVRLYEVVHTCGDVEVVPKLKSVDFGSTINCTAADKWEYLGDCDNRNDSKTEKRCIINFEFGTIINKLSSSYLHQLGLNIPTLLEGLEENFAYHLSPSKQTRQYWSEVNSSVWDETRNASIQIRAKNTYRTMIYRLRGSCHHYEVYTNVIKEVLIPGLMFCGRKETTTLVAEYTLPFNSGGLSSEYYYFYLHAIGIDFKSREYDVEELNLSDTYKDLENAVQDKFNFEVKTINSLDKFVNKDEWIVLAKHVCIWTLTGSSAQCSDAKALKKKKVVLTGQTLKVFQSLAECGEIKIFSLHFDPRITNSTKMT